METILTLLAGLAIGAIIVFFVTRKKDNSKEEITQSIKEVLPELNQVLVDQVIKMANEKLGAEKNEIRTDMENKRAEIERLMKVIKDDLKDSKDKLEMSEKERVGMFGKLEEAIKQQSEITKDLKVNTENLKKVLSNNQLRGQFGEQVADELLKMAGFVRGVDYEFNKEQEGSSTRPDFAVFLPDGTRINVDSKFPFSNLQKAIETDDKEQAKVYLRDFEKDVKDKIKQVCTRDYINPEDKTVDFVILFIPNEMIFSYIYEKLGHVWIEAMEKKVVLAGPFSFTALLRMIKQSYDNFKVQANIQTIVGHIKGLEKEFLKFTAEFDTVGKRIKSLSDQYEEVSRTRVNGMNRIMEKVRLAEPSKGEESQPRLLD